MRAELAAALILSRVERRGISLRGALEDLLAREPSLEPIRAMLEALCLGVLRSYRLLSSVIRQAAGLDDRQLPPADRWLARVLAYELRERGIPPDRLEDLATKLRLSRLDLVRIRDLGVEEVVRGLDRIERLATLHSQPAWVVERIVSLLGYHEAERLLQAFNMPHPLWARVNTLRISRDALLRRLAERGVEADADEDLDDVILIRRGRLSRIPEYREGLLYPQDKASALVAHVLEPREAMVIADLCSAPGSKATHIAQISRGKAKVIGIDISPRRLRVERRLCRRLGLEGAVGVVLADGRCPPLREADAVLVDPDCSGLGALGKSPELRIWLEREGPGIVRRLARLQAELIVAGARLLRRGGVLVYSTCTLTTEENEEVVRIAMAEGLEPEDAKPRIGLPGLGLREAQRLYPHLHRTIGFFVVKLRRSA